MDTGSEEDCRLPLAANTNPLSSLPTTVGNTVEYVPEKADPESVRRRGMKAKLQCLGTSSANSLRSIHSKTKTHFGWGEFKEFMVRANIIGVGVGFVFAQQFQGLVATFTSSFVTPLIIATTGEKHFSDLYFEINNARFNYGTFLNSLLSFLLTAMLLFYLMVRPLQKMRLYNLSQTDLGTDVPGDPAARRCPYCYVVVPKAASKCRACASGLMPALEADGPATAGESRSVV